MLSPQAVARVQFSILCSLFLAQPGAGSVILPTNTTAVELVSFVPQDSNRDTLSLVISCLLTLSLCVYTAVHLNVPLKHEPAWQTRLREAKWCMIGLLGPELVLFAAWRQWNSAKALTEIVEQVLKDEKASGNASSKSELKNIPDDQAINRQRRHKWTMVHAHYATMGGFTIELDDLPPEQARLFGKRTRLTLTAQGVALLAQCGHLPDVAKEDIVDKSKEDWMTKILVIIQAGWMIVQVVSRLAVGLPVTQLEVNTLAHVVCALVMYALWWDKPRLLNEPTRLEGEWVRPLAAFMYMSSHIMGRKTKSGLFHVSYSGWEFSDLLYVPPSRESRSNSSATFLTPSSTMNIRRGISRTATLGSFVERPANRSESDTITRPPSRQVSDAASIASASDENLRSTRWDLALQAISMYEPVRATLKLVEPVGDEGIAGHLEPPSVELVADHASNWPNNELLERGPSKVMGMILWAVSVGYGAIHVAAWHEFFPTVLEAWLWRASAVWVSFSGILWLAIHFLAYQFPFIAHLWTSFQHRSMHWVSDSVIWFLCIICGIAYLFARGYLVVEAFVSIRLLPKAAYDTPAWLQVLPHL